jgi:hypothetical protein
MPSPEEQRKKGSVKGHRYNTRQPREQSIQKPMLVFLDLEDERVPGDDVVSHPWLHKRSKLASHIEV